MKNLLLFLSLTFFQFTYAWEFIPEEKGGAYTSNISTFSTNRVSLSLDLECDAPSEKYYCSLLLFREDSTTNSGLLFQTGTIGTCDAGGIFENTWVSDNAGKGIQCGKGSAATCTSCLNLIVSCKHVESETYLTPTPTSVSIGDCP